MDKVLNVLVACEESQAVCKAFRALGHNAYSCDLLDCTGGHPEWHIKGDALLCVRGGNLSTVDGQIHSIDHWDIIIAHPPCTHLSLAGAKYFEQKRSDGRQAEGIELFAQFLDLDCAHVAIENPMGIIQGGKYLKEHFPYLAEKYNLPHPAQQKIQPYQFGDPYEKTTLLWLKGLPNLIPTNVVKPEARHITSGGKSMPAWYSNPKLRTDVTGNRQSVRSKTFKGIAEAMASQWSEYVLKGGD